MATYSAVLPPAAAKPTKIAALAATTSSSELPFPKNRIIAIQATGDVQVVFGVSGSVATADATGWYIPQGRVDTFDMSDQWTAIKIYNPGASAVDVYILELGRN